MAIIQLKNIFKQFSGDFILKNISFSIENKDKIGLVGLNGTGKSTLIRILLNKDTYDQNEKNIRSVLQWVTISKYKKGEMQVYLLDKNSWTSKKAADKFCKMVEFVSLLKCTSP